MKSNALYFLRNWISGSTEHLCACFIRENGWNVAESLLLDGGNEDPSINLKKVMFWPYNIVELFQTFEVKKQFDLLSVDMDSYDWFTLEKILEAGYRPRVVVVECNTMFDLEDSKSVMPPQQGQTWNMWDGTRHMVGKAVHQSKRNLA